jgi:short-subunit dehydrogenase
MELARTQVGVSVLCPGLVDTSIGKPGASGGVAASGSDKPSGLEASKVGDAVVAAVSANRFYIFTHPEYQPVMQIRSSQIFNALSQLAPLDTPDDISYLAHGVLASMG